MRVMLMADIKMIQGVKMLMRVHIIFKVSILVPFLAMVNVQRVFLGDKRDQRRVINPR
jgi:hypothetical protein